MIAGLVATHDHEDVRRSIGALAGAAERGSGPRPTDGGPSVWMLGADPALAPHSARSPDPRDPCVAFDGRLCNLRELELLAAARSGAQCSTPAGLVAALWRDRGIGLLDSIVGDFALALWDPVGRELLLAADPLGQRPLYYAESADGTMLAFASRTNALRRLDWVGSEPDDETVVANLLNLPVEPGRTFHRAIRQVPGGHVVRWLDGRIGVRRYWGPNFPCPDIRTVDAMLEAFEHTVRIAVADRLDPARPTALLLSGGYDSTAVAGAVATLRRESPGSVPPVVALSGIFPGLPCDESARIDVALAENGLPARRFNPLGRGVTVESMQRDVVRHDAPVINFQAPFADAYAALAREFGAVTLMTGLGGDELAIDFDYQIDFVRQMGWLRFPETVRRIARIENRTRGSVATQLVRELCPEPHKRPYRAIRRLATARARRARDLAWLDPATLDVAERLRRHPPPRPAGFGSHTQEVRWRIAGSPIVEASRRWFALEADAAGLELASPLLDRRLFELVFAADARVQPRSSDRGDYKPLIARGLPYAPGRLVSAFWKVDFQSYDTHVMQQSLGTIEEWLFGAQPWSAGRYVSREAAVRTVAAFRESPERMLFRIGAIVGLETWMRSLGNAAREP